MRLEIELTIVKSKVIVELKCVKSAITHIKTAAHMPPPYRYAFSKTLMKYGINRKVNHLVEQVQ